MEERRAVGHVLRHLKEKPDGDGAIEADVLSKTLTLQKKRKAFKKRADEPLGTVIERKLALCPRNTLAMTKLPTYGLRIYGTARVRMPEF